MRFLLFVLCIACPLFNVAQTFENKVDNDNAAHQIPDVSEISHTKNQPEAFQAFVVSAEVRSLKRYLSMLGE